MKSQTSPKVFIICVLISWVKCLVPRIQFEDIQLQKFKDMLQQCIETVFRSQTDPSLSLNLEKAELNL